MVKRAREDAADNLMKVQPPTPARDSGETSSLATELGRAYQKQLAFYREHLQLTPEEADLRALGLDHMAGATNLGPASIRECPPEHLHWSDLTRLGNSDPDELMVVWEELKGQARDELDSGHRTAKALEWEGTPWDRVRFLAIRNSFLEPESRPGGVESILVDMTAAAVSTWLELSEQLNMLLSTDGQLKRGDLAREGRWSPSRQVINEEIERTERRVEQAHKRVLRSLKMLTDIRRVAPTLIVGHAAQVNVGQQQVNVAPPPDVQGPVDGDLPK